MKHLKLFLTVILGLAIFAAGCGVKKHNPAQVKKDLDNNNALFAKSFNSKDATGVGTFYADDAELLPPNAPEVKGRDNIQNYWQQAIDMLSDMNLTTDTVVVEGDAAIETGNYTINVNIPNQPPSMDKGKYMVVWKYMQDGKWKIFRDMFNSSLPLPQSENSMPPKK